MLTAPAAPPAVIFRASFAARANGVHIENARRRALAVQVGLDLLEDNHSAALEQLENNRNTALDALRAGIVTDVVAADIQAVFESGVDTLGVDAHVKQTGLETELVAADAAHAEAIEISTTLAEVRATMPTSLLYFPCKPRPPPLSSFAGRSSARRCFSRAARS